MIDTYSVTDLNKLKEIYQFPYYAKGRTTHRNHKNEKLQIEKGSYFEMIYKDMNPHMRIKKCTQVGISEYCIVRTNHRAEIGKSVFYVFPTYELKNQFVKERTDKALSYSKMPWRNVENPNERWNRESMSLKQIGRGVIAYVGSNSKVAFTSFQADDVVIDEFDLCNQENIVMTPERQSHSKEPADLYVGNPTIVEYGIDEEYSNTDQKEWHIRCNHCGKFIRPEFFGQVVFQEEEELWLVKDHFWARKPGTEPQAICPKCDKPYNRFGTGEWVKQNPSSAMSGYHFSKMFSTNVTMMFMLDRFTKGLVNETVMQRFYNADLGLAYTPKGSKVDREMLNECRGDYLQVETNTAPSVAGIDVGTMFNMIVGQMLPDGKIKVTQRVETQDEQHVIDVMKRHNVKMFVIDAMPETRIAKKIIARRRNGFMCYYGDIKKELTIDVNNRIINTIRTSALDAVKEALMTKSATLPSNADSIPGFYDQMCCSTRVYDEGKNTYNWVHGNKPDHDFHAFAYMLLARRILLMAR